jgi:aminopeptidase S
VINVRVNPKPARTGLWNAVFGGQGVANTSTLSQTVAVPAGCGTYTLSFWLRVDTADTTTAQHDRMTVTLGTTTLATYSNLDKSTGYVQRTLNVAGQAGKTVALTFGATEDASPATSFAIDDTALTVT